MSRSTPDTRKGSEAKVHGMIFHLLQITASTSKALSSKIPIFRSSHTNQEMGNGFTRFDFALFRDFGEGPEPHPEIRAEVNEQILR